MLKDAAPLRGGCWGLTGGSPAQGIGLDALPLPPRPGPRGLPAAILGPWGQA